MIVYKPDIINITEQQFFDYIECPAKYNIKYINKITYDEPVNITKYISQLAKNFMVQLQDGKIMTFKELQKKWDTICTNNNLTKENCIKGWKRLTNFVKWAQANQIIVGDTSVPYRININNIILTGIIDFILIKQDRKTIELLYPYFGNRVIEQYDIDSRLKYTLDALAFKDIYNTNINGIKLYCAKSNETFYSYRTEQDYNRLRTAIYGVANSINNNLYYPRESMYCNHCAYRQYCKYWSINIENVTTKV